MALAIPFGAWVRRRRRALDLSQQQLGDLVGCATITVRKIEAGDRRPSRVMAERLAVVLGIPCDERDHFVAAARSWAAPHHLDVVDDRAAPTPLPASLTDLVGRDREAADLSRLLAIAGGPARLVTVIGPPGVGKTRLALEVGRRFRQQYDVWPAFAALATESESHQILEQLARAYSVETIAGTPRRDALVQRLRRQPELAILDNLEHLPGAGEVVVRLLEDCPGLTCLCTSRTRLDVYGEYEFPVGPLPVYADGIPGPAVTLFIDRCRAVGHQDSVGRDVERMAGICRRLDGLPLAIELAARRTRDLTLDHLWEDLGRGLAVLDAQVPTRDARHHTMSSTIEWSYELLAPEERRVLRALGATTGSISSAAVQNIAAVPSERAARAVGALEASSLIRVQRDRVVVLEVIRAFAEGRLRDEGEEHAVRHRLSLWLNGVAERDLGDIDLWPGPEVVRWLGAEDANLRSALRWTLQGPGERQVGVRLLRNLALHWYLLGKADEVRRWVRTALEGDIDPELAGQLAVLDGIAAYAQGDVAGALARLDQADPIRDRLPAAFRSEAAGLRAMTHIFRGELEPAHALLEHSVAVATQAGSPYGRGVGELRLGRVALIRQDVDAAEPHLIRALAAFREMSNPWGVANVTGSLAELALARGDVDAAVEQGLDAVAGMVKAGAEAYAVFRLTTVANALSHAGRHETAARVAGIVEEWLDQLGTALLPVAAEPYETYRKRTREALGPRDAVLVSEGRLLPREPDQLRRLVRGFP